MINSNKNYPQSFFAQAFFRTILFVIIISISFQSNLIAYAQEHIDHGEEAYNGEDEVTPSDPTTGILYDGVDDTIDMDGDDTPDDIDFNADDFFGTSEISASEQKIVFANSDEKILQKIVDIGQVLPDAYSPLSELANLSGKSEEELTALAQNSYQSYLNLIEGIRASYDTPDKILAAMITKPEILTSFLDASSETEAIEYANTESIAIKKTIQYYMDTKIDKRVIETLNYLTRPKDDPRGGAGHWKIRVHRLIRGYTNEDNKYSEESDATIAAQNEAATAEAESQTVETYKSKSVQKDLDSLSEAAGATEEDTILQGESLNEDGSRDAVVVVEDNESDINVSAHFKGQAVDISAIDEIKCTLIEKKRIGGDKKTAQAPTSIKLAWQTTEGYNEDEETSNSSLNKMLWNLGLDNLGDLLAELNIDYTEMGSLNGAGFSQIASLIGQGIFSQLLDTGFSGKWGASMESTLRKIGGVFLADDLSLPRGAFVDPDIKTIEDLSEAVGRAKVETNMKLSYGSLKGANREEIIFNVGKYRLSNELDIPIEAINHTPSNDEDFFVYIGSSIMENTYGFPKESFYKKENYAALKTALGGYKLDAIMAFPTSVDDHMGLEPGTTALLKADLLSVNQYCTIIAKSQFNRTVYAYKNNLNNSGTTEPTENINNTITVTTTDVSGGTRNYTNIRDEVFGLPEGTLDRFAQGHVEMSMFWEIGIKTIADTLEDNDIKRADLANWLRNPNTNFIINRVPTAAEGGVAGSAAKDFTLSRTKYASIMGVEEADVYKILGTRDPNAATGLFMSKGEDLLKDSLRTSTLVERTTNSLLENSESARQIVESYEFYSSRIKTLKSLLPTLKDRVSRFKAGFRDGTFNLETSTLDSTEAMFNNLIDKLDKMGEEGKDVFSYIQMTGEILTLVDSFRVAYNTLGKSANNSSSTLVSQLNAICQDIEKAGQIVMEIATGEAQPSFRLETISLSELSTRFQDVDGLSISGVDMAMVFSGKVSLTEFLVSFASAKIAKELDLPPSALKYASRVLQYMSDRLLGDDEGNLKDAFFRGFGLAEVEKTSGTTSGQTLDNAALSKGVTAIESRDKLMSSASMSKADANKSIAKSFGLQDFDMEKLLNNDFAEWQAAKSAAEANDSKYGLDIGTTEAFIKGVAYGNIDNYLEYKDTIQRVSATLGISEPAIKVFMAMKEGSTTEPYINKVYYLSHNNYAESQNYSGTCSTAPAMPDNTWYYYDADGLHTFSTQAIATEYAKTHADREINWKKELEVGVKNTLSKAFRGAITAAIDEDSFSRAVEDYYGLVSPSPTEYAADYDLSNFSSDLDKFLKGETNDLFQSKKTVRSDVVYLSAKDILSRFTSIRQTDYDIMFTHTATVVEGEDSRPPVDYLKEIGQSIAKDFVADYVANYIGVRFGSNALNSDDIFNLFSGNALQTFEKIGASILEEETSLPRGSIFNILNASNSAQRECALAQTGSVFLGELIGVKDLDLGAIVRGDYAQTRVESALDLPKGSFKGENMAELIADIPPYQFITSFGITPSKEIREVLEEMVNLVQRNPLSPGDKSKPLKLDNKSFSELLNIVIPYVQGLGIGSPTFSAEGTAQASQLISYDAFKYLWNNFIDLTSAVVTKFAVRDAADADYIAMLAAISPRLSEIDTFLGVTAGSLLRVFKGEIKPTDYTSLVKSRGKDLIAYDVIRGKLGINEDAMTNDTIDKFRNAINDRDFVGILTFSATLFDAVLDKNNRFPVSIVQGMITKQVDAKNMLILEMTKQLDTQFGLDAASIGDDKPYTFSELYAVYAGEGEYEGVCGQEGAVSYKECIERYRVSKHESGRDFAAVAHDAATFQGATVIADFIQDKTNLKINVSETDDRGVTHSYTQNRYGIEFTPDQLLGVFKGDLRPFKVIGMAYGMKEVMGDADGNFAVDNTLLIMANDLLEYYYGDPVMSSYAEERARLSALSELRGGNVAAEVNDDNQATNIVPATTIFNVTEASNEARRKADIDTNWPVDASVDVGAPATPSTETADYLKEGEDIGNPEHYNAALARKDQAWDLYEDVTFPDWAADVDAANMEASKAAEEYRTRLKEELEYKAMDCVLFKLDSRIPAGFAYSMIKGNGFMRTTALLGYFENYLKSNGVEWLGAGTFSAVYSYFRSSDPAIKGNLESLVASAGGDALFDQLDGIMKEKIPYFGEFAQEGTAAALFAFYKTGDISTDVGSIKSLGSLYNGKWVAGKLCKYIDIKLGLPSGFSAQTYSFIKQYSALNSAKRAINGVSLAADATSFTGVAAAKAEESFSKAATEFTKANPGKELSKSDWLKQEQTKAKYNVRQLKAEIVTLLVTTIFADQLSAVDESLGLVPGSMSIVAGVLINWAFGVLGPHAIAAALIQFVIMNLFGVYKTELRCTADGHYPSKQKELDASKWDVAGLGEFDGLNEEEKEKAYISAAQYKARRLVIDLLEMPARTGDSEQVPSQIMTGRSEDVVAVSPMINNTICKKTGAGEPSLDNVGVCSGWLSRAGIWANLQTTSYTHIGF